MKKSNKNIKETKGVEWLDKMHDARNSIGQCAFHLEALADAFFTTGNTVMGTRLAVVAEDLHKNSDIIHQGIGEKISEQLRDSQQATGNMLAIALNMATMKG